MDGKHFNIESTFPSLNWDSSIKLGGIGAKGVRERVRGDGAEKQRQGEAEENNRWELTSLKVWSDLHSAPCNPCFVTRHLPGCFGFGLEDGSSRNCDKGARGGRYEWRGDRGDQQTQVAPGPLFQGEHAKWSCLVRVQGFCTRVLFLRASQPNLWGHKQLDTTVTTVTLLGSPPAHSMSAVCFQKRARKPHRIF